MIHAHVTPRTTLFGSFFSRILWTLRTAVTVKTVMVESFTVPGKTYTVRQTWSGHWTCTCPHFFYRLTDTGKTCKHINAVAPVNFTKDIYH